MAGGKGLPSEFTDDTMLWPVVVDLLNCYEEQLTSRGLNNLCAVTFAPGAVVDLLNGEDGVAWIRVDSAFPSTTFPSQEQGTDSCGAFTVANLELGLVRCFTVKERSSLTPAENAEYLRVQLADYAAMRAAANCCNTKARKVSIGVYTPYGPEGGIYGGVLGVSIQKAQ